MRYGYEHPPQQAEDNVMLSLHRKHPTVSECWWGDDQKLSDTDGFHEAVLDQQL